MKFFVIIAALVAVALSDVQGLTDADARTLYRESDIGIDKYRFAFDTSNGIHEDEQGELQNVGAENEAFAVRGSYSYTGPDKVVYTVNYIADENGFQPSAVHLPVGPN